MSETPISHSRYAKGFARAVVPARTALVGNPSDGFGGATVALALDELSAVVEAEPELGARLLAGGEELRYENIADLAAAGGRGEYPDGGPLALLMAAAKRFFEGRPELGDRGIELRLTESSIPGGVGLAGSSAIVVGALRVLGELFGDELDERELPFEALACETEELGITAGLQDRIVQTTGGLVFMDFSGEARWEPLDPGKLPSLFVAWTAGAATHSGHAHADVLRRFETGDREVVAVMREIGELAKLALQPLITGDGAGLGVLMDRNLELRRRIYELDPRHLELAEAAGSTGSPVNYSGSGGAIVGLLRNGDHLADVREALEPLDAELLVRR